MQFKPILSQTENKAIFIAGPCSAESEEQVLNTAKKLAAANVDLYRAGIWKPRTRPNSFEGVGELGLKWLQRVKREVGMKVTTEVANAEHVRMALEHEIDVLWLGARTTVNPFSVQEIANELKGVDIPVMIKNPINPDLKLWIGAIERIYQSGIDKIAVIHRGFSSFGESDFRNQPRWQMPIELKRLFPDLQIICDSSHICGNRHMLEEIAQRALDLNFEGVMMEVHPNPDEAWSDKEQQITPETFIEIMNRLVYRKASTDDMEFVENLQNLREQIDEVDNEIFNLYSQRMKLSEKIAEYKKRNNISILQSSRWGSILEKGIAKGSNLGLSEEFTTAVLKAVHQESINHQSEIMNKESILKK